MHGAGNVFEAAGMIEWRYRAVLVCDGCKQSDVTTYSEFPSKAEAKKTALRVADMNSWFTRNSKHYCGCEQSPEKPGER